MFLSLQLVNTIYDEGKDVDNEQIYAELLHAILISSISNINVEHPGMSPSVRVP